MSSFLGGKSRGAFWVTSAAKRLFDSVEVLNLSKKKEEKMSACLQFLLHHQRSVSIAGLHVTSTNYKIKSR